MVIGIDIRVLGSHAKSGIEEYTENLLSHILSLNGNIRFKLFYSSLRKEPLNYDWIRLPNVELYRLKIPNKLLFVANSFLGYPRVDELIGGVDVFFSPHFLLTAVTPECKRVITFHDLSYEYFPDFFSWRRNMWHIQMKPLEQLRFADKIIAVSKSTKTDLCNRYLIDPAKVEVIYSGISEFIKKPTDRALQDFKSKNNLPDQFILFLAKLEPRKNITGIIKAFRILKKSGKFDNLHLLIAGSPGWLYKEIFNEASRSEYKDQIIFKNHIEDGDRSSYYSLASVFVYPSFFEGFGFPPLEAMSCGTPVVVSNNSSLPEVVGGGGVLVDPYNVYEISFAISAILTDDLLRAKIIFQGFETVKRFNWQEAARKTLTCLTAGL